MWDLGSQNPQDIENALHEHIDNQRKIDSGEIAPPDEFSGPEEATSSFEQESPSIPKASAPIQPVSAKSGRKFSSEEIGHLKRIASHMHQNQVKQRNHYADPKVNPKNAAESHIASAMHDSHGNLHESWAQKANSPEYKSATTPQRWRQQLQFRRDWHAQNPDHLDQATDNRVQAKDTADKIHTSYLQNKKAGLESIGAGGLGVDAAKAAAHFGTKTGSDEMAQVGTREGLRGDPTKAKEELSKPKYQNLPQEQVEVGSNPNEFKISHMPPDLQTPQSKELMQSMAANYAHIKNPARISKLLANKDNIDVSTLDEGRLSDAADAAMWRALHHFSEYRSSGHTGSDLDSYIRNSMNHAIRNDAKAQLSESRVTKEPPRDEVKRKEGLKEFSPEEKEKLKQQIMEQHQTREADKAKIQEAQAQAEAAPKKPKMSPEEQAAWMQQHGFSDDPVDDSSHNRLGSIKANKG